MNTAWRKGGERMRLKTWRSSEYFRYDVLAAVLGVGLIVFFACTARYGIGVPDESYFYAVPQRLLLGEKWIADEWNFGQLVHLINVLPYFFYVKLNGSAEGLILFMRYFFIAAYAGFYAFAYTKLRFYKGWGLAAAFLFFAVIRQTLFGFYYCTFTPMATLTVWFVLADGEKAHKAPTLILTGILMACGILTEPFLIVLYLMWFVLTLIRTLRRSRTDRLLGGYDFALNRRAFFWMSVGAAAMFFSYMGYLIASGSFEGIGASLPYMLSGKEYNSDNLIDLRKIESAIGYYGKFCVAGSAAAMLAAVVFRVRKQKDPRVKRIIFAVACVFLAAGYVSAGIKTVRSKELYDWFCFLHYSGVTLLLFSPTLWLLCEKKTPRLFALWVIGVLYSALVDAASSLSLCAGSGIISVACLLQMSFLLPELKMPAKAKKGRRVRHSKAPMRVFQAVIAVCAAAAIVWNMGYVCCETLRKPFEFLYTGSDLSERLDSGPFKGLYTNETAAGVYNAVLTDLDTIRELDAERAPVAVIGLMPFAYLHMNLPCGAYSSWYEFDEPERLAAYWRLRPERVPAYIYIPYCAGMTYVRYEDRFLEQRLSGILELVSGETTEGAAGYIITNVSLKDV